MHVILIFALVMLFCIIWKYWSLAIGAGYDPTPMDKVYKMLEIARVDEKDILYDLGSGDGRIVMTAAKKYGARTVGIEADPLRYIFSWFIILFSGYKKMVQLQFGGYRFSLWTNE
jgi:cyclopropane fatty-acyl-phospholipid synthase-like methyltransferase